MRAEYQAVNRSGIAVKARCLPERHGSRANDCEAVRLKC
jgi:hypothetical protein